MTDLNKEREAFEEALGKHNIHNVHLCTVFDFEKNEYFPSDVCDPSEDRIVDSINLSWKMWQEKAKAQAVPETHLLIPKEPKHDTIIAIASVCLGPAGSEAEFLNLDEAKDVYQALVASESGAEG